MHRLSILLRSDAVPATQPVGAKAAMLVLMARLSVWIIRYFVLRERDQPVKPWATRILAGAGPATTPLWPPVSDFPTCG